MDIRPILVAFAIGSTGCNIFYGTEKVELQDDDPVQNNVTNPGAGECDGDCTCGDDCELECERECELTCERGSTCSFTLEEGGSVQCEPGSFCHVECEDENCAVACEGSCTMDCAPRADFCGWTDCEGPQFECGRFDLACDSGCPQ